MARASSCTHTTRPSRATRRYSTESGLAVVGAARARRGRARGRPDGGGGRTVRGRPATPPARSRAAARPAGSCRGSSSRRRSRRRRRRAGAARRACGSAARPRKSLLAERAVADVADPGGEQRRPVDREPPDRDLDGELLASRVLGGHLDPRVEDLPAAVGAPSAVQRASPRRCASRWAGGTISSASSRPSGLLARVAEDLLRGRVELEDAPVVVDRDQRIDGGCDRRGGMRAADRRSARAAGRDGRAGACPHVRTPRPQGHQMDIALRRGPLHPSRGTPNGGNASVGERPERGGTARRRGSTPSPSGASRGGRCRARSPRSGASRRRARRRTRGRRARPRPARTAGRSAPAASLRR